MKRLLLPTIVVSVLFGITSGFAQMSASVNISAQITILAPVSINCETPMVFPDAIPNAPEPTLTADTGASPSSGYTSFHAPQPAGCVAKGEPDTEVCISLSSNGSMNMDGRSYPINLVLADGQTSSVNIQPDGTEIHVAGVMNWDGANVTPDTYTSNVGQITVTYDCPGGSGD